MKKLYFKSRTKKPCILLEIIADDQDITLDYLRNGQVSLCVSTSEKSIPGCSAVFLGYFEYLLVATRFFINKYLGGEDKVQALLNAPALKFDKNDDLHDRYLEKNFDIFEPQQKYQIMPSVQGFKQYVLSHRAYGLIPKMDIVKELKSKQVVPIFKDKPLKVPLYLHYWELQSKLSKALTDTIISGARKWLQAD